MSQSAEQASGFTLLEVLVAVIFLAVVMSGVMTAVTQTIRNLDRAHLDIDASDLAQDQLRGVALAARQGTLPEPGTTEGSFEGEGNFRFELKVEAYDVPVADADRELAKRSSVFGASENDKPDSEDAGPSVRRITLRVYREEEGVDSALPLTMFVTKPLEVPESATDSESTDEGSDQGDDDGNGQGGNSRNRNGNRNRNQAPGSELPSDGGGSAVGPGELVMQRRDDGFTLLEILIVIAVTSLLLTTAFQMYIGIMNAQERALAENRRDGVTALVLDRLEGELVGTLLVKNGALANGNANSERAGTRDEERAGSGERKSAGGNDAERAGNDGAASDDGADRDEDEDRASRDDDSGDSDEEKGDANPWIFIGADGGPGDRASDSIRFVTQTPARGVGASSNAGLRVVSYEVRATDGDRAALYRAEDLLSAGAPEPPNFSDTPAVDDVYRLQIRYQGEDATWVDDWNSQIDANKDDLPLAVELTLQLEEPDAEGVFKQGRQLTRVVALPLRPIGDEEDGEDGEGSEDCGDGKTIEQCLADNEEALSAFNGSPESKSLLDTLRSENGKRCVDSKKVAREIASLNDLLREAGVPNLKQLCGRK